MTDNREPIGTFADYAPLELHVDEEPWQTWATDDPRYRQFRTEDEERIRATVDDRSPAVIVWLLGAIVAALIVAVAVLVMSHE